MRTKQANDDFYLYINRMTKAIKSDIIIDSDCKDLLNQLLGYMAIKYITYSVVLCRYAKRVTIDSYAIKTLTYIWLCGESDADIQQLVDFADQTWNTYSNNITKGLKKNLRAQLYFQPSRFQELFRIYRGISQKVSETAYVFLTAIIEYICKLILDESIKNLIDTKLTSRDIYQTLSSSKVQFIKPILDKCFFAGFGSIDYYLTKSQKKYLKKLHNINVI